MHPWGAGVQSSRRGPEPRSSSLPAGSEAGGPWRGGGGLVDSRLSQPNAHTAMEEATRHPLVPMSWCAGHSARTNGQAEACVNGCSYSALGAGHWVTRPTSKTCQRTDHGPSDGCMTCPCPVFGLNSSRIRISKTYFFVIVTTHNDQTSHVKHGNHERDPCRNPLPPCDSTATESEPGEKNS